MGGVTTSGSLEKDPRTESALVRIKAFEEDVPPIDLMGFLAIFLAGLGLLLKNKPACWASVLCCLSAAFNAPTAPGATITALSSFGLPLMSLAVNYSQRQ